jgi:hypothetical protein
MHAAPGAQAPRRVRHCNMEITLQGVSEVIRGAFAKPCRRLRGRSYRGVSGGNFAGPNKDGGGRSLPRRGKYWNSAYGGLQILLGLSKFVWLRIRSALRLPVASLSSRRSLSTLSRLSRGTAPPSRVTHMVRPLLLAEPGPGDAPRTTGALAVFFHPPAVRRVGLPAASRSVRSGPRGPSLPSCESGLAAGGLHLTGDSNYSDGGAVSKAKTTHLNSVFQSPHYKKISSS